jgi:hypothetical protein
MLLTNHRVKLVELLVVRIVNEYFPRKNGNI